MREIKFRAWDEEKKYFCSQSWIMGNWYFALYDQNTILMQYTGLKDKNGVEIYEGDVLFGREEGNGETTAWTDVHVAVFFNDKYGRWQVRTKESEITRFCDDLYDFIEDYEVIGNIYENPELLEK